MVKPQISEKALQFKRARSPIREIMDYADPAYYKKLGIDRSKVLSFAGGWVNHNAPEGLQKAYQEIVFDEEKWHQSGSYSATLGNPDCRQAIVDFEKTVYGVEGLHPDQVVVGVSSTHLAYTLMQVLLNPEDKVCLLDPSYCNYPTQIFSTIDCQILRFQVVDPESFESVADQKIEEFRKFILENKPKAVVMVTPDNPSSQVLSDQFVRAALEAVQEIGSFLVLDFAYKEMVYGDKPEYFSWAPSDHLISIHSNSKWCRGLGRRMGWLEGPEPVMKALEALQGVSILVPDTLHQMAFTRYIQSSAQDGSLVKYIEESQNQYQKAAEATMQAIEKYLHFPYLEPKGGIFTCMKVGRNGAHFVEEVLKQAQVLFVPGWGFGRSMNDAVRVSFGPLVDQLELIDVGFERVGKYLESQSYKKVG